MPARQKQLLSSRSERRRFAASMAVLAPYMQARCCWFACRWPCTVRECREGMRMFGYFKNRREKQELERVVIPSISLA